MTQPNGHKPPAPPMESRQARSIRFTPAEWAAICDGARQRMLEPSVFVRVLTMYALSIAQAPTLAEAAAWMPGYGREVTRAPLRTRRL